jgi:hypothetical protein
MARTAGKSLHFDIRPAVESLGLDRVIEQVGIDRIIEHIGVKKLINHIGLARIVASLSAAERKELRRLLQ